MYPDLAKPWEKWYLEAVQTNNILIDVNMKNADKNHTVFENKDVWKIYLAMDYGNGHFRSSHIVSFNRENMTVTTRIATTAITTLQSFSLSCRNPLSEPRTSIIAPSPPAIRHTTDPSQAQAMFAGSQRKWGQRYF